MTYILYAFSFKITCLGGQDLPEWHQYVYPVATCLHPLNLQGGVENQLQPSYARVDWVDTEAEQ